MSAAIVEDGQGPQPDLAALAREMNTALFGGRLDLRYVEVARIRRRDRALQGTLTGAGLSRDICLLDGMAPEEERQVLCHELIHLLLLDAGEADADDPHGEPFCRELERIGGVPGEGWALDEARGYRAA